MARVLNKLNSIKVKNAKEWGFYGDGGGLYLQISKSGSKSWAFRYMLNKKSHTMGLGSLDTVSLAEARELARKCRQQIKSGLDPITMRNASKEAVSAKNAKAVTFKEHAEAYIKSHRKGWNEKHGDQWENTLTKHVYPKIGGLYIESITTDLIMQILEPLWQTTTETASRIRNRIELVIDYANAKTSDGGQPKLNPARWRGHLDKILPKRSKVQKVKHHASLPYQRIGKFMSALRKETSVTAKASEFIVLTAVRTGEALGAKWNEINFEEKKWIIPASRMKAGIEHHVPLSPRALELLESLSKLKYCEYIFPGTKGHLSNTPVLQLVKELAPVDPRTGEKFAVTTHGMRSTFRTWCSECTSYPREICESALAHVNNNKVESAYDRTTHYKKRILLMNQWAAFCAQENANMGSVIGINRSEQLA